MIPLLIIIGLAIGSFLNVVIFRMDDLKSILKSRSHCPNCKKILKWYDLIPFVSFVLLRAKCRYCGKGISWQYPLVEISTGLLFGVLYYYFGFDWSFVFYAVVFSFLMIILVYDIRTQTVPESFVWATLAITALFSWYIGGFGVWSMLLGGLVSGGILALLVVVSKEKWMGAGDVKIGLIQGFLAGYPVAIFASFLSFVLGAIFGLFYIKARKKTMKDTLPFAPFLIISTIISILFGNVVVSWYFSYMYLR